MTTKDDVTRDFQHLFDSKEIVGKYWNALVGDGAGTVADADNPALTWVRYLTDQSKTSKVVNPLNLALVEDIPVIVGRRFPDTEYEEILAVDVSLYVRTMDTAAVEAYSHGRHGDDHNAATGTDPASIDLRNIVEMRGRPRTVPDLTIFVEKGQYQFGNVIKRFPTGIINLAASVPGGVGHRYVLVYIDAVTNLLDSDDSIVVPIAATPPIPAVPANTISICVVDLEFGQTTITEDDIFDWRFLWQITSFAASAYVGTNAARLLLVLADLAELTRFYTTDTDKIWEVWEGAWRLIYPPAALSESDGDAGTPWTTNATGVLTGTQDLVLDDGVGDSPAVLFRGGSNNDEIQFFLDDDAVATHSDLVLNLADNDGHSEFRITDFNSNIKFQLTSEGDFTQTVENAITNTTTDFQTLTHLSTGAAAAGFGIRQLFRLEDAGGAEEDAAAITVAWENAGAAAEGTLIAFWLRKAGAALGPFIEFGATENVFNEGGADIDFRVEGVGEANALFVQGSDGKVGMGVAAPTAILDVRGKAANTGSLISAGRGLGGGYDATVAAGFVTGVSMQPMIDISGNSAGYFGGYMFAGANVRAATTLTTLAGMFVDLPTKTGTGTITQAYGLYVRVPTIGTTNVCAYLEGKVGIGALMPGSLLELNMATEDLEFVDAGSAAATELDWIEVQVGGNVGYIHVFAAK